MSVRTVTVHLLLAALVALPGCAVVRHQADIEEMYEYTYSRPLEDLWPEVRRFCAEQGFPMQESPGQYVMVSDWVTSFDGSRVASGAERIYVRGLPFNRGNSQIVIYHQSRMTGLKGRPSHRERNNGSSLMVMTADEANPIDGSVGAGYDGTTSRAQNHVFTRDVELEWKLLKRLAPEDARSIEAGQPWH